MTQGLYLFADTAPAGAILVAELCASTDVSLADVGRGAREALEAEGSPVALSDHRATVDVGPRITLIGNGGTTSVYVMVEQVVESAASAQVHLLPGSTAALRAEQPGLLRAAIVTSPTDPLKIGGAA